MSISMLLEIELKGTNATRQLPTRERNYSSASSRYSSSFRHQNSLIASNENHGRDPQSAYNRDTQRAILSALTKLQNDVHHILERLNRLETSAALLQQVLLLLLVSTSLFGFCSFLERINFVFRI